MEKLEFSKCIVDGVEVKRCRKTIHSYKMHMHNELTIGYIEEGSTTVVLGEKEYKFRAGDAMIIPPLMSHMCSPDDIEKWQTVILYVSPYYYESAAEFTEAYQLSKENVENLLELLGAIEDVADEAYVENLLIGLLVDCAEDYRKNDEQGHADESRLEAEVAEYIKDNYLKDITLSGLEDRFGINKFTIIRNFKSKYNTTPMSYQLQLKLAEAKNMLFRGLEVLDVCDELRFYDQAHFIREFKKTNGITPAAYKNELIKN